MDESCHVRDWLDTPLEPTHTTTFFIKHILNEPISSGSSCVRVRNVKSSKKTLIYF